MNVLELFSGTGSVGKCCEKLGWNAISVDLLMDSTHKVDILEFDYKQYPKDHFGIVWASPPCTNYSTLQNCWINRMRKGKLYTKEVQEEEMAADDKLVLRTLEIIEYFNPTYWFIENPASSKMKDRKHMIDLPNYVVDYCMYSDWGYRKRTRIWTNKKDFIPKVCDGSGSCGNMVDSIHTTNCGNTERIRRAKHKLEAQGRGDNNTTTQLDRYRIPEDLIYSLFLD